jgi:hypothetical protein
MRGVCGGENQTKLDVRLSEVRSRLYKNKGTHFILHFSLFIPWNALVRVCTHRQRMNNEECLRV